jgi:hypothetical protein
MNEDNDDIPTSDNGQLGQEFWDKLSISLGERIKQCGSRIPVVTGKPLSLLIQSDVIQYPCNAYIRGANYE